MATTEHTTTQGDTMINSAHRTYTRYYCDQALMTLCVWPTETTTAQGARHDLARLLDLAHSDALDEDNDRHDDQHTTGMHVCAWCDLTIADTDDLLDQLGYSTDATINALIRAELDRRTTIGQDVECVPCIVGTTHCAHCPGDCSECVELLIPITSY